MKKTVIFLGLISALNVSAETADYTQYVNPLMGTQSSFELSTGNTYPVIARPWGMNFWTPVTGKMGDGWQYTYDAYKIRGFEQTHQPSPWINDYGQFAIMPVTGSAKFHEDDRASWFSHKAEEARPYYYKEYLADHDVVAEMTPTDRAAMFRFTFPENDSSFVVVDAYDRGSAIRIIPEKNRIVGYTTRNSGGVPENFRNYFVVEFDKPFTYCATFSNDTVPSKPDGTAGISLKPGVLEQENFHTGALIGFRTGKGERVHARVASSFISPEQAELNLKELADRDFDKLVSDNRQAWNDVLGRVEIEDDSNNDRLRNFYSCLYRSLLFPRKFYEIDASSKVVHYSPYNGEVKPGYMYTDTGLWDTFRSATHDIACDGVYMSELSNSEQSKYIGWQGGFYNIAKIVGTGLLVYLAGVIIRYAGGDASGALPETVRNANRIGWSWVMALVGAIMLIIGVYHIFVLPSGGTKDCRKERSASDVARELTTVLGEFFRKKHIWYCLTFNIPFVVYAVLAYFQPTGGVIISAGIILEYFGYGFGFVGLTLFMMQQVAPGKHQMAHYAFASGIMNFGVMLPGMLSGWVCNMLGGYTLFFIVVTILTIVPPLVTYFVPFKYNDDGSLIAPAVDGALTQGEGTE